MAEPMKLTKISYGDLNARQKENFNYQKLSAVLADYGFVTMRLSDDWQGADLIAQHVSGNILRVQLKGRCALNKKYEGKDLYIAFADGDSWYLFPHDDVLQQILSNSGVGDSLSWRERGDYHFPVLSKQLRQVLEPYRISGTTKPIPD